MSTGAVCVDCGRAPRAGLSRSRCGACYNRHIRAGTRIDLPRVTRARADVVDDYLHLRAYGKGRGEIARQLGMTVDALHQALKRAALAGDTRIDYRPRNGHGCEVAA